ncbi:MAG TPA: hypothetical protein ENN30_01405, partial [Candidatus Woesearchaeota archaeon]|nr:hypothetical protein [Candidatus Woesearchaeota archaeon]
DHYLELVKGRAYNKDNKFSKKEQAGAVYTLHYCLKNSLKLLAPICPFITEKIWSEIYSDKSIHVQSFPELSEHGHDDYTHKTEKLVMLNSTIWKYKKEKGLALNSGLKKVYIPEALNPMISDIKAMHNIDSIESGIPEEVKGSAVRFENVTILE